MYEIKKASDVKAKARILISGIAKSGKTYTALQFAKGFGNKILLLDTEYGSASKYSDVVEFDTINIKPPYDPQKVIDIIILAETKNYDVLIIDSISHFWGAVGGFLDIHQDLTNARKDRNSFAAWQDLNPIYEKFVNSILKSQLHIIVTVRQKSDYIIDRTDTGKIKIVKAGLKIEFRDNFEFNFDVLLQMTQEHYAIIEGSRFSEWDGKIFKKPDANTAKPLLDWLNKGDKPKLKKFTEQVKADMIKYIYAGKHGVVLNKLNEYDISKKDREEINNLIIEIKETEKLEM